MKANHQLEKALAIPQFPNLIVHEEVQDHHQKDFLAHLANSLIRNVNKNT